MLHGVSECLEVLGEASAYAVGDILQFFPVKFRWRLVGWEVKGFVFHTVPGNVMYKQFNDAVFAPDVSIMKT